MRYREASRSDFNAVATTDGLIYHQRGGYEIIDNDGDTLIPANRSYRQLEIEESNRRNNRPISRDNYTNHDRIINDSVDNDIKLRKDERLIKIFGKAMFCLDISHENIWQEFSTGPNNNTLLSKDSSLLLACMEQHLERSGLDVKLGVYGSHQVGLNKSDSDLDLIASVPRDTRSEAASVISDIFRTMEYLPVHESAERLGQYATRYSERMGLPMDAGYELARQRMRWISPDSVSTSLQLIHSDYDHNWARNVVDTGLHEIEATSRETVRQVEVLPDMESYNFPRLWKAVVRGKETDVISFDWAHQGMGTDTHEAFTMRARRVTTAMGKSAYILHRQSDFILPTRLTES